MIPQPSTTANRPPIARGSVCAAPVRAKLVVVAEVPGPRGPLFRPVPVWCVLSEFGDGGVLSCTDLAVMVSLAGVFVVSDVALLVGVRPLVDGLLGPGFDTEAVVAAVVVTVLRVVATVGLVVTPTLPPVVTGGTDELGTASPAHAACTM